MHEPTSTSVSVDAVGIAWVDGTLYVQTRTRRPDDPATDDAGPGTDAPATQLVLRERDGSRTIAVPTVGSARTATDGPDGEVVVRTESRLDPRRATKNAWLPSAVWDLHARTRGPGGAVTVPVGTSLDAHPALVAGRQMVAYRNQKGNVSLDASGRLRSVVNDGRPRLREATVRASDGPVREVAVSVRLDGVRVHGRGSLVGVVTADPVERSLGRRAADAVRRRVSRPAPARGTARLVATRDDVTLTLDIALRPGRWRAVLELAGTTKPSPLVLTVPRSGPVTIDAPHGPGRPTGPVVSVVVAGHDVNALRATVASALDQSIAPAHAEVVVVPGRPGDPHPAWLRQLESGDSPVRTVAPPSPDTSSARNAGLDVARGRYVTFLDADDRLTPQALEKLVEAAEATAADVVLGTVLGITRRRATPKAFTATELDADFTDQRLFDTLTPHQLFRRAHLAEHGLRFADDPVADAGAAFAAEAALRAERVVTLADTVYYERFVTGAVAEPDVAPDEAVEGVLRVAETIARHVTDGPRRDTVMRRPAAALMDLVPAFAGQAPDDLDRIAKRARERFGPFWTDAVRAGQDGRRALLLDTLLSGDGAALADLLAAAGDDGQGVGAVADGTAPRFDVPPSVRAVLGAVRLAVPATAVRHLMTAIEVTGGVARVTGWVAAPGLLPAPDGVRAGLRLRGAETETPEIELPVALEETPDHVPDDAAGFTLQIDAATLTAPGRWDLYVAPTWAGQPVAAVRFGARRPTHVDEVSVDATGRALASPRTVLYATAGYGNLSVSHEDFLTSDDVDVTRLALDEDGRPEVVLATGWRDDLVRFDADVEPCGGREAPHRLPWRRLDTDGQEIAVRLPVPVEGELRCVLSAAHKDVLATVHLPEELQPVEHDGVIARRVDGAFVVSRSLEEGAV